MVSSLYSLLCVTFLTLAIIALYVSPAVSTSRQNKLQNGFRVTLKHVDSGKNLTKWERIERGIKRGNHRLQRLNAMVLSAIDSAVAVQTPVSTAGHGEFLMDLAIGTPPESYSAIVDTGSDLIWTQCVPCPRCFYQPTPMFDPKKSSSFSKLSCSSDLCAALPQSTCSDACKYHYAYGEHSTTFTQGFLASETFTFGKVLVPDIGFGCGEHNEGVGFSGSGLVGLGRGPLSLVSQLKAPKFSYCLTSMFDETQKSTLLVGSIASVNSTLGAAIKSTQLIQNPEYPSLYYLSLEGISVGGNRLPIQKSTFALQDDGTGGLITDSGTTFTYLVESAFDVVKKEFVSQMKLPVVLGVPELDLCFTWPSDATDEIIPKVTFHFEGVDLDLPVENYMINPEPGSGLLCLAMGRSTIGISIFGNIQQQNFLLLHDLETETLSFIPTQCDKL